jgi:ribosomal-protein-serine acetyltransferase
VNPIRWDLGDGIVVRTLVPDEDAEVFALVDANRDRLRPWMLWEPTTRTPADVREFIERSLASEADHEANGIWLDGALAGSIGLSVDVMANSGEIGYWLGEGFEGRGIMTRACHRFLDFGFDELRLHRIELCAAVQNERSRAVAIRLGMTEEGIARDGSRVHDGYLDLVLYGLLEDEWRARR